MVAINPALTTNAAGLFSTSTQGMVQGVAMDDPAVRYALSSGQLASTETLPMWGGVALSLYSPLVAPDPSQGGTVARATTNAGVNGFSVFNQAFAGITSPQSPVPLYAAGQTVNYYRIGSGARIPLKLSESLAASLDGGIITQQVSWDFTKQELIAYSGGIGALNVRILEFATDNCKTVSYDSGTGYATWATSSNALALVLI